MSHDNVWEWLLEQCVFQLLPESRQRISWRDVVGQTVPKLCCCDRKRPTADGWQFVTTIYVSHLLKKVRWYSRENPTAQMGQHTTLKCFFQQFIQQPCKHITVCVHMYLKRVSRRLISKLCSTLSTKKQVLNFLHLSVQMQYPRNQSEGNLNLSVEKIFRILATTSSNVKQCLLK